MDYEAQPARASRFNPQVIFNCIWLLISLLLLGLLIYITYTLNRLIVCGPGIGGVGTGYDVCFIRTTMGLGGGFGGFGGGFGGPGFGF